MTDANADRANALAAELNVADESLCYLAPKTGPKELKAYRIDPKAENTLMVYRNYTVAATFVNLSARDAFQARDLVVAAWGLAAMMAFMSPSVFMTECESYVSSVREGGITVSSGQDVRVQLNYRIHSLIGVLEFLAALPTPEEIVHLRPSPRLAARVAELIEKSKAGEMTPQDEEDWERYEYLEHLVRMAKAAAQLRLAPSGDV